MRRYHEIWDRIQQVEFEWRIFVSLSLVIVMALFSSLAFPFVADNLAIAGKWINWKPQIPVRPGYLIISGIMLLATLLRMWAGSILTSGRVMSFKVQNSKLMNHGPYQAVRNPIYLADLIAFTGFALCLKPVGLLLPVLIFIHYNQLVSYEEKSMEKQFGNQFLEYKRGIPRFFPTLLLLNNFLRSRNGFSINYDGFRHNAIYLLFIPGFIVSSFTGSLSHAILIGLPAVFDWAIVHTIIGLSKSPLEPRQRVFGKLKSGQHKSKVFSDILYAQCWEDPEMDRQAFNIKPDDVIFSITSGGCNVLTFLLDNPKKIIALDFNPCQNYLLELKMAAFRVLTYDQTLEFFGVLPSDKRMELYTRLRPVLQEKSLSFWDQQADKIITGIIHTGRYERYMHMLQRGFCFLMGRSLFRDLFEAENRHRRKELFEKRWNNLRWRSFTRFFLSRFWMTLLFDKAFFTQVEKSFSFGSHFRHVAKRAITELPVKESTFLAYIMFGNYCCGNLPPYLRRQNYETIRQRLNRIQIVTASAENYFTSLPDDSISKFNFTNIFEWMPYEAFESLLKETIRIARNGSVITYRNLLVPRSRPESLARWIKPENECAQELHKRDLSFIYRAYHVELIEKQHAIQGANIIRN